MPRTKSKKPAKKVAANSRVENNPNGANQYVPDPRQAHFLSLYLDPKSETYSNVYKSALEAGFSEEYAKVLKSQMPTWLSEKLNDRRRLRKAEKNLDGFLDLEVEQPAFSPFGPILHKNGKPVKKINTNILKVKADVTKFVAKGLGKTKYSERHEHTGADGKPLYPVPTGDQRDRLKKLL